MDENTKNKINEIIGKTQKDTLDLDDNFKVKLTDLNELNSFWFKNFFKENV